MGLGAGWGGYLLCGFGSIWFPSCGGGVHWCNYQTDYVVRHSMVCDFLIPFFLSSFLPFFPSFLPSFLQQQQQQQAATAMATTATT